MLRLLQVVLISVISEHIYNGASEWSAVKLGASEQSDPIPIGAAHE
jgi:hypothetical protein